MKRLQELREAMGVDPRPGIHRQDQRWLHLHNDGGIRGTNKHANGEFRVRVLHPVQQHVHAGQVVGGDVLFLAVDLAYALRLGTPLWEMSDEQTVVIWSRTEPAEVRPDFSNRARGIQCRREP